MTTPLLSNPIERTPGITLEDYPTGIAAGAAFGEAFSLNPSAGALSVPSYVDDPTSPYYNSLGAVARDRARAAGDMLTQEQANAEYGIPGELTFDHEMTRAGARYLYDTKRAALERRSVLQRARQDTVAQAVRLGASFLASAVDPINVASAFIPVVGEARYALWTERYGATLARLARGATEGVVGAAAVEPLVYSHAQRVQADYTAMDSLLNVTFGGALGGGLHLGLGWLSDRLAGRPVPEILGRAVEAAPPATRQAALRGSVAAIAEGLLVRVAEQLPELDPVARAAGEEFDRLFGGQTEAQPGSQRRADDLTAGSGLMAAPPAKAFDLGPIEGTGAAARHGGYTPVSPGDRPWLEGVAADVKAAQEGSLTPRFESERDMEIGAACWPYAGDVVATPGTFPRWFTEMNKSGAKVTREIVERVARKLLAGEPLGAHEGRVAQAMMAEARALREENARQMMAHRAAREEERRREVARLAEDETPWEQPEDRQAAAAVDKRVQPALRQPEEQAIANDVQQLEQEVEQLARSVGAAATPKRGAARRQVDAGDVAGSIMDFVDEAMTTPGNDLYLVLGKATPEESARLAEQGIAAEGYTHTIDQAAVRHVLRKHGEQSRAVRDGGEMPVTADDFARVPEILRSPDAVERSRTEQGLDAVLYRKRFNGDTFYLEEVRGGREALSLKTMWKRPTKEGGEGGPAAPVAGSGEPDRLTASRPERSAGTAQTEDRPAGVKDQPTELTPAGRVLSEEEQAYLDEADALVDQAEDSATLYEAAAGCLVGEA